MLLNYDFLEFENGKTENRTRDYSLTKAIDKELEAKRLSKLTRARVKVKEGLSLRATLDAFGDEISRLKREQNTETIKALQLKPLVLTAFLRKSKADYLLELFQRLGILKTLLLKTLMLTKENC
ncbi:hypothetical protein KYTH41_06760 [Helicobacter pylori]